MAVASVRGAVAACSSRSLGAREALDPWGERQHADGPNNGGRLEVVTNCKEPTILERASGDERKTKPFPRDKAGAAGMKQPACRPTSLLHLPFHLRSIF